MAARYQWKNRLTFVGPTFFLLTCYLTVGKCVRLQEGFFPFKKPGQQRILRRKRSSHLNLYKRNAEKKLAEQWENFLNFLPAQNFLSGVQCHGKTCNYEIRKCKTHKKVVVNSPQFSVENDTEDDQKIGEDGDNDDEDKNKSFKNMQHTKVKFVFIQGIKSFIFS